MKRFLSLVLAAALCLSLCAPALAEEAIGGPDSKPYAPFEETVKIKVVESYTESEKPGFLPSTSSVNDQVKKYLNIEFDWMWEVPSTQYDTKLDMALASKQYPDILQCDFETYCYLKEAGLLADLSDVWEEYACEPLKASLNKFLYNTTEEDGRLLGIPYANDPATTIKVLFWRTDWLKALDMEMPSNLDEFTAIVKAMRDNDPDGNGEKDTYGLAAQQDPFGGVGLLPVFHAFNAYPTSWLEKDGALVNGITLPEVKDALDYLRDLYADGYINPEFATLSEEQVKTDIVNSEIGVIAGDWSVPDANTVRENVQNNINATWACSAMPGLVDGVPAAMRVTGSEFDVVNVVLNTASEEAKIGMIKLLNFFYDYNFYATPENGGSGWDWYTRTLDKESEEYKAINDAWYSWWLPVTIWNPAANYEQTTLRNKYIATGEWDDSIYFLADSTKATQSGWINAYYAGPEAVTNDNELLLYANGMRYQTTRFDDAASGNKCSLTIVQELQPSAVVDVYYGSETETGTTLSSTLNDYAVQYINRYIMGLESEDSFDKFVSDWLAMGGADWTAEANEAWAALK